MKKRINLKRVLHRDKWRILISFDIDEELASIVRKINNVSYSDTYKSWYVDDEEENLKQILVAFRDKAEVDISELISHPRIGIPEVPGKSTTESSVKELNKADQEEPEYDYEEDFEVPDINYPKWGFGRKRYGPVEFRINENDGRLVIKFTGMYEKEWIDEIKSFGRFYYDKVRREFLLPWSVMTGDSLSDYFSSKGVEVKVIRAVLDEGLKKARHRMGDEIRCRELGVKAVECLDLMERYLDDLRYSERTNLSYLALLEFFFKYFNNKDPMEISMEEVSVFIHDFIVTNGYSASYQSQMISAIKTFYRIAGRGRIVPELFERPRRGRALPKVFSKEEVQRILNSTRNIKHKVLLWLIYSCGLRRSEVTNVCVRDLDRERSVLHIKEGKGQVDRIVPVSKKVWEKLDEYIGSYQPGKYLFEGQAGGRYSVESVYRVFKQALRRAGIRKEVGVHSLRHSYATHLHESGLDIRYIQELLGHKSSRTTEIYTHVSRRNLMEVRSPIEDMDVR